MENVWATLHTLQEREPIVNLIDYNLVMSDDDVIHASIHEFRNAQNMLTMLNMKGSPITRGHDASWFNEPWKVEQDDLKHLTYVPFRKPIIGEDGDCEVLRDYVDEEPEHVPPPSVMHVEANLIDEDLGGVAIIKSKT